MHFLRYFLDKGLRFQPAVCNGCRNVKMMSFDINIIAILNIFDVDYRCIINRIRENGAINLLRSADLSEKSRTL